MEGGGGGGEVVLLENAKGVGVAEGAEECEGGGGGDEPGAGTAVRSGGDNGGGVFGVKNVWVGLGGNGFGVFVGVVASIQIG